MSCKVFDYIAPNLMLQNPEKPEGVSRWGPGTSIFLQSQPATLKLILGAPNGSQHVLFMYFRPQSSAEGQITEIPSIYPKPRYSCYRHHGYFTFWAL